MKAAPDVIAHASERHRAQRPQHDLARLVVAGPGVLAQQEEQLGGTWKLRRVAETAKSPVERLLELLNRAREGVGGGNVGGRRLGFDALELTRHRFGRVGN